MDENRLSLPGLNSPAPDFSVMTTFGPIKLSDYRGKWVVLFSHPGDFTPVCTTEFIAFTQMNDAFEGRNAQLLGLSVDSNASHIAWVRNIESIIHKSVPFPIIDDRGMAVARLYGMISPNASTTATVRTVFIIDDKGMLRLILYYPLTTGRNTHEVLRALDALQFTDRTNLATPANWMPGEAGIIPAPGTVMEAAGRTGGNCLEWYLCTKKE